MAKRSHCRSSDGTLVSWPPQAGELRCGAFEFLANGAYEKFNLVGNIVIQPVEFTVKLPLDVAGKLHFIDGAAYRLGWEKALQEAIHLSLLERLKVAEECTEFNITFNLTNVRSVIFKDHPELFRNHVRLGPNARKAQGITA